MRQPITLRVSKKYEVILTVTALGLMGFAWLSLYDKEAANYPSSLGFIAAKLLPNVPPNFIIGSLGAISAAGMWAVFRLSFLTINDAGIGFRLGYRKSQHFTWPEIGIVDFVAFGAHSQLTGRRIKLEAAPEQPEHPLAIRVDAAAWTGTPTRDEPYAADILFRVPCGMFLGSKVDAAKQRALQEWLDWANARYRDAAAT